MKISFSSASQCQSTGEHKKIPKACMRALQKQKGCGVCDTVLL